MNKIELSSVFLIGHKEIDADHAELVEIINEMADGYLLKDASVCQQKWQEFCQKLDEHTINEERIMGEFGYFDDKHKDNHETILETVINLGKNSSTLADWNQCFFKMWNEILTQILNHDLYFAQYLAKIGYEDI